LAAIALVTGLVQGEIYGKGFISLTFIFSISNISISCIFKLRIQEFKPNT